MEEENSQLKQLFYGPKTLTEEHACSITIPNFPSPQDMLNCYRRSALIHRAVRALSYNYISPQIDLLDFTNTLESDLKRLSKFNSANPLKTGQAFPTGVNVGHIAAHDSPNPIKDSVYKADLSKDVISIDFGVHTYGYLIDCAYSITYNPVYIPLIEATKAATEIGIKSSGAGVRLCEIGEKVQEVMESYTVELPQDHFSKKPNSSNPKIIEPTKNFTVKVIENLNGHNISRYKVHAGKSVPSYNNKDNTKMAEGEIFAIETFGSTGRGLIEDYGGHSECSHYMLKSASVMNPLDFLEPKNKGKKLCVGKLMKGRGVFKSPKTKKLAEKIVENFGGLAFCKKWLNDVIEEGSKGWAIGLRTLEKEGFIEGYPPLADVKRSQTSQYEHTIYINNKGGVVNLSKGDDY